MFRIEGKRRLHLKTSVKLDSWVRFASKLVKDRVIMDLEEARKMLKEKGDVCLYEVFDLKKIEEFEKIEEEDGLSSHITLLRGGIFSLGRKGECFCTYGHRHEKKRGEFFYVLKNTCMFLLYDKGITHAILLREGEFIFVHPNFVHRAVSLGKDVAILDFVPNDAGHDYQIVKQRGFPFHVFLDKEKREVFFRKNGKVEGRLKIKIGGRKAKKLDVKKIARILKNPPKFKKFYLLRE